MDRIGPAQEQWLVSQAYEQLGQLDSAAAFCRRALAIPGSGFDNFLIGHSFIRQRLVLLCARTGRLEEAERELAVFERDFTHPDPDVRHLRDEAHSAVRSARVMSGPAAQRH